MARRSFEGVKLEGTDSFVSSRAPLIEPGRTSKGKKGFILNLVDTPIRVAAKSVLADILGLNYIIDPRVKGTVTLQTTDPLPKDAIIDIFEATLAFNNAGIIHRGGQYHVVPINDAISSTPSVSVSSVSKNGVGIQVLVIELRNIAADEMRTILEPISRDGSIIRVDSERNYIMIAGNRSDLHAMKDSISVFDVDWMRGMSVALHPLKTSQPTAVVQELETIFKTKNGPGKKLIRFVANERLNSILVITSRAKYLARASAWIDKLDKIASTNEEQLFVYQIKNRSVKKLAEILQSILAGQNSDGANKAQLSNGSVAPDLEPVLVNDEGVQAKVNTNSNTSVTPKNVNGISVVADVDNNSLLISTTPRKYKKVEQILRQLDVLPTQVLLEAIIAEVTLNDELKFGVRWAIEKNKFRAGLSDLVAGFVGAQFPGFNFGFATHDLQVTLNALSSITDVNVISSPTLMVLNNHKAVLQVGDQVPIVTQQTTGIVTNNAPVVNSVELKDTGIILTVVPRVNSSGSVTLEIEQEVSSVVQTTTSGIDSPTIRQRKISTTVVVNDGESLALGGLIQERNTLNRRQVPILGKIPFFGNIFKNKTDKIVRTELIIFIRPRVVRDVNEAREVTAEFRNKLTFDSAIKKRRGGANMYQQDLKRLKY
ncbi:MAG: type II secretion system secretin GspD [Rhodobacteraceae bacterium]|nr:type II secretion system secretin GspD [Paracoccaceae bacterium]